MGERALVGFANMWKCEGDAEGVNPSNACHPLTATRPDQHPLSAMEDEPDPIGGEDMMDMMDLMQATPDES